MSETVGVISLQPDGELLLVDGDLTQETTDAIVNAANRHLAHWGGVAAAIVRAGGSTIREDSQRWIDEHGPIDHGRPALTGAGDLLTKAVIHVVGPRWGEGDEDEKLRTAVQAALKTAEEGGFQSLAMPPVSTGVFGFPVDRAAGVFLEAIRSYFSEEHPAHLTQVRIVIIDDPTLEDFQRVFHPHFEHAAGGE